MEIFRLDEDNEMLNHAYKDGNIKILRGMAKNKKCLVFCSSNGIYFPNTIEVFKHKMICNDFYDWSRTGSFLIEHVELIIFIRDIRKNFYVTGINEQYSTVNHVIEYFESILKGYEVTVAGSSAGGYMASILGVALKARLVVNIGGQWNLYTSNGVVDRYYFLNKYRDVIEYSRWYDLRNAMENNVTPIFYLYSANNIYDKKAYDYIKGTVGIYEVAINSIDHAKSVSTEALCRLLMADVEMVKQISLSNRGTVVDINVLEKQIENELQIPEITIRQVYTRETKNEKYLDLLYKWIDKKQKNMTFMCEGNSIAIWGKGKYFSLLLNEFDDEKIKIKCIIESQPSEKEYMNCPIVSIQDMPEEIDTIIVIPYYDIENIKSMVFSYHKNVRVIGIDELVNI